jgi:hypothetical protein
MFYVIVLLVFNATFIEVPVPSGESRRSFICVLGVGAGTVYPFEARVAQ